MHFPALPLVIAKLTDVRLPRGSGCTCEDSLAVHHVRMEFALVRVPADPHKHANPFLLASLKFSLIAALIRVSNLAAPLNYPVKPFPGVGHPVGGFEGALALADPVKPIT